VIRRSPAESRTRLEQICPRLFERIPPEDIGYAICYLLSDASEFMTGYVMVLDGGLTAKMALPSQPTNQED